MVRAIMHDHNTGHPDARLCLFNFQSLSQCGTIEFRGAPGVKEIESAKHWIAVTLGFFSSALSENLDSLIDSREYPTVEDLSNTLHDGIKKLGPTCAGSLRNIEIVD